MATRRFPSPRRKAQCPKRTSARDRPVPSAGVPDTQSARPKFLPTSVPSPSRCLNIQRHLDIDLSPHKATKPHHSSSELHAHHHHHEDLRRHLLWPENLPRKGSAAPSEPPRPLLIFIILLTRPPGQTLHPRRQQSLPFPEWQDRVALPSTQEPSPHRLDCAVPETEEKGYLGGKDHRQGMGRKRRHTDGHCRNKPRPADADKSRPSVPLSVPRSM